MKTLYKCLALILALGCWQVSLAKSNDPAVTITISGAAGASTVCPGSSFTARANVSNTSTSGLIYEWSVSIGTANGLNLLRTNSTTATIIVNRPFDGNRGDIKLRVLRSNSQIAADIKAVTVLSNVFPSQPNFITVRPDNPNSPTGTVICQNSGATFSIPAVTGANQYLWTVNGSTRVTSSPSFSTFFNTTGSQTVSVRASGCAGTSASRAVTVTIIPANQSPCNNNQFSRTASPSAKSSVSTYPNPVENGTLKVEVSQDYLLSSAQLIDQKTGRTMKSFTITDQQSIVATNDLPKGTYLLKLQNKEAILTRRIIIE